MTRAYDVIVLGLGAVGSAAAYQLARRRARVLGLDRFAPPHAHGSSHGVTRLTRQAIGEGDSYTPLALRSHEIWRDLERRTGEELYVAAGGLILCDPDSAAPVHGRPDFLRATLESAQKYGIRHDVLTAAEVRARFPPFNVAENEVGYYEHGAGFLRPERCVRVQLALARGLGADLHTHERVLDYAPAGDGVRVRTDRGEYEAGRLIVAAGPWAAPLLGDGLRCLFNVYRQVQFWFDVAPRHAEFTAGRFPVFIRADGGVYGFPAVDGPGGGIKVAAEDYSATTTPDAVDRDVTPEETRAMYERRVRPFLDGVGERCLRAVVCLYTVTPDFHFVLGVHPEMPPVIVASPCSGHGFKHSAAVGEALAELATAGETRVDIGPFSPARFAAAPDVA